MMDNDEIFWLITEDINLIERIYEILSLINLPEGIEYICIKLLIRFIELNKENEDLIIEVKKDYLNYLI